MIQIPKQDIKNYYQESLVYTFKSKSVSKFYKNSNDNEYPLRSIILKGNSSFDESQNNTSFFFLYGYKVSKNSHWETGTHCPIELLKEIPKLVDEFLTA